MTIEEHEIVNRWYAFLDKIEVRFNESLEQAKEACMTQLEESNYDYYTVFSSWMAMKSQIQNLDKVVDDTWDNKLCPYIIGEAFRSLPKEKQCGTFTTAMHEKLHHFQMLLEGELSEKYYDHAIQTANQKFHCTQCHSPLEVKKGVFRSHYVTCPSCLATNTFTPDTKYAHIGGNIVDNIVAMKCYPLYQKMGEAINTIQAQRPPVAQIYWDNYKQAYFNYYETFFKERIKLNAEAEQRFEADMERKKLEYEQYEKTHR